MIEKKIKILSVQNDEVVIESDLNGKCSQCSSQKECVSGLIVKEKNRTVINIPITDHLVLQQLKHHSVKEGLATMSDGWVVKISALIYFLPLFCMMFTLWLMNMFQLNNESVEALLALLSLIVGFFISGSISKKIMQSSSPLKICPLTKF